MAGCKSYNASGDEAEVKTEVKIEIDVAEDPSLYRGIMPEQHLHVLGKTRFTRETDSIHTKPTSPSSAVLSTDSCTSLRSNLRTAGVDARSVVNAVIMDDSADSTDGLEQLAAIPWSKAEIKELIIAYSENRDLLEQQHCPLVTEIEKNRTWVQICNRVNCQLSGSLQRTVKQMKKKLSDLKANTKSYLSFIKYPPTGNKITKKKLWYYELILKNVIGRVSPILDGVQDSEEDHGDGYDHLHNKALHNDDNAVSDVDTGKKTSRKPDVAPKLFRIQAGKRFVKPGQSCTTPDRCLKRKSVKTGQEPQQQKQKPSVLPPPHLQTDSRRLDYDHLVRLEIQKNKQELQDITQKQKEHSKTTIRKENLEIRREQQRLKRDRAMFALEIEREKELYRVRIEREHVELVRQKEQLKRDQLLTRKAELEVMQLSQALGFQNVVTLDEHNQQCES